MNRYQSVRTLFNLFLSTIVLLSLLVSISARYLGDSRNAPSASPVLILAVQPDSPG